MFFILKNVLSTVNKLIDVLIIALHSVVPYLSTQKFTLNLPPKMLPVTRLQPNTAQLMGERMKEKSIPSIAKSDRLLTIAYRIKHVCITQGSPV